MTMENISTSDLADYHVLIVAAGQGSRMGTDTPKQYLKIDGKYIIEQIFNMFSSCNTLISVIHPDYEDLYRCASGSFGKDIPFVYGGAERRDSVYNGLRALSHLKPDDIVLIHDAARPFTSPEEIRAVIEKARQTGAATLAMPVADTLRHQDGYTVDRGGLWAIQTPQAFHYGLLCEAHEKAAPGVTYTDDSSMVAALGHEVSFVMGSRMNFKITTPDDFAFANLLSAANRETRTGSGYDVHAFKDDEAEFIKLCGIDIPHHRQVDAHSDGDVGLHALTDALLSTIAAGDIGTHFPPSSPQWKNADSSQFLAHAVQMVRGHEGRICHLDVTIICERPKVGPYREQMQRRIAEIAGIDFKRVSIKATTSEKLGFTGREEGIVAQALATVEFPRT